jgi:hypothetical protein
LLELDYLMPLLALLILGMNLELNELELRSNLFCYSATPIPKTRHSAIAPPPLLPAFVAASLMEQSLPPAVASPAAA